VVVHKWLSRWVIYEQSHLKCLGGEDKKMIVEENEATKRFFNDLMRMYSPNDDMSAGEIISRGSGEDMDELMLEIELSDPDIFDPCDIDYVSSHPAMTDPVIAISRRPLADSRRKWHISRVIIGARNNFSA
jgi:hypothetical protein